MLKGIIDPSHEEQEFEGSYAERLPMWYKPEELLAKAKIEGPKWSAWNYELIYALLSEFQERDYISTTALLGCPRSTVLERREDYIATSLDDFYAAFRGTMVHRTLEFSARPGSLAECRFFTAVEGVELSCSPDLITPDGDMWDYKVPAYDKGVPSYAYPWPSNSLQGMFNAYIVRHATKVEGRYIIEHGKSREARLTDVPPLQSVTFQYLGPGSPKPITWEKVQETKITRGKNKGKIGKAKLPYIWTDKEVLEGYINSKGQRLMALPEAVMAMRNALEQYPDIPPEALKLWGGPNDYRCTGKPFCKLPYCLAKRYPDGLYWERPSW